MTIQSEAPGAGGTAFRGDKAGFGNHSHIIAAAHPLQLAGTNGQRLVVLGRGLVVAWAVWVENGGIRIHVVAPLRLGDPPLKAFRQIVRCADDAVVCQWGAL